MSKIWHLQGISESFQIARRSGVPDAKRAEINHQLALLYIDRWLADPATRLTMVEMYEDLTSRAGSVATRTRGLDLHRYIKPGLIEAFRRGEFVLLREPHVTIIPVKEKKKEAPAREEQKPVPEPPKRKAWVEIEVIDEDDNPVPDARFVLELPDGSMKRGTLGADGRARLSEIEPGTCKVSFPDFDASEWEQV